MKTKRFNYRYDGQAIRKDEFEKHVPENWQDQLDQYGYYSYGYYSATLID
ncbi:MAG: hypothetical protein PHV07_10025 [Oscillospiraceae bacterium]|nr:hypothetical protein [Oscillospiraceae bacterium]